jgi:hypothetical protein
MVEPMRQDWWDSAEAEMSAHFGMRVIIDDAVPDNVWGYIGDFAAMFGDEDVTRDNEGTP